MYKRQLLFNQFTFAQSKLKKAKENLDSYNQQYNNSSNNSSNSSSKNSSGSSGYLLLDLFLEPIIWIGAKTIMGNMEGRKMTPHPYFNDCKGEYFGLEYPGDYTNSLLNASAFYVSSKDAVKGISISADYRFIPVLGAELSHLHFYERYLGETHNLDMSSLLLKYYRVREKYVTAWWGLGATYVANEVKTTGFSYAVGAEVFPINPISIQFLWKQTLITVSYTHLTLPTTPYV